MEEFAKVEKLREATGVTFEDSRNALRACDGDMIDAMVYLEKLGKVTAYVPAGMDKRNMPISAEEIAAVELKRALEEAEMNRLEEEKEKNSRKARKEAKREAKLEKKEAKIEAKREKIEMARERRQSSGGFGAFVSKVFRFLIENKITISKEGKHCASIPLLAVIILCAISFGFAVVALVISVLCGYEYSFNGAKENSSSKALDYSYSQIKNDESSLDSIEKKYYEAELLKEEMKRLGTVAQS